MGWGIRGLIPKGTFEVHHCPGNSHTKRTTRSNIWWSTLNKDIKGLTKFALHGKRMLWHYFIPVHGQIHHGMHPYRCRGTVI